MSRFKHSKLAKGLLCGAVVVVLGGIGIAHASNSSNTDLKRIVKDAQVESQYGMVKPTGNVPKNQVDWNDPKLMNTKYQPDGLKKNIYFKTSQHPGKTFVATQWKWSNDPRKLNIKRHDIHGTWQIAKYQQVSPGKTPKLPYPNQVPHKIAYTWHQIPSYAENSKGDLSPNSTIVVNSSAYQNLQK